MDAEDFEKLTNPRSVAVVGASEALGSYGWRVLKILLDYGREHSVDVVNPRRAGHLVQGVRAHGSLRDLQAPPDCTVIVVPPPAVPGVLEDMAAVGGRVGVVLSAPHAQGAETARAFDRQLSDLAGQLDLCLVGPNSMGLISPVNGFAATFGSGMLTGPGDADPAPAGGIAMISQSGAAISYLLEEHRGAGIGYSHLFSTGNEIVVDLNDLMERLVADTTTHSIVLFVESVGDGRRLREGITAARNEGKAVVIMRIGSTAAGQLAAQSHSGRLAGDTGPYRALADDTGAVYVESYQHLFDSFRVLNAFPPLDTRLRWSARRAAAIVTTSGGAAVAAVDELEKHGWTAPSLSADLRQRLDDLLGEPGHDNPLDLLGLWRDEWRIADTLRVLAASGELDAVIVALGGGGLNAPEVCRRAAEVTTSAEVNIPIVFANLGLRQDAQRVLRSSGAAMLSDLPQAVRGLEDRLSVAGIRPAPAKAAGHGDGDNVEEGLPAGEVLQRLAAAGVRCVPWKVVDLGSGHREICAAAEEVGFPVAIKIEHAQLLHKSDIGAVALDIRSEQELAAAVDRQRSIAAGAGLDGAKLVVQAMAKGVEVIVGARRDESFGQVVVLGLGGTMTELVRDVRLTLLPTTKERIAQLVAEHDRLSALLAGHRGSAPSDVDDLVEQIFAIAQWVSSEEKDLVEFDANPLVVNQTGARVVDARAVLAGGDPT